MMSFKYILFLIPSLVRGSGSCTTFQVLSIPIRVAGCVAIFVIVTLLKALQLTSVLTQLSTILPVPAVRENVV